MAAGLELAGIVLAALPLLISTLEHRDVGLEPLNAIVFKKRRREALQQTIDENNTLFRHCCEKMLSIAELDNIADLLARDNSDKTRLWIEPSLKSRLKSTFGQNDFNVIQLRLVEIDGIVRKLQGHSNKILLFSLLPLVQRRLPDSIVLRGPAAFYKHSKA